MSRLSRILVILGPTASGKSELAVRLAKRFNGEVVSADSRQVYRGLDIGTGKVARDTTTMTDDNDYDDDDDDDNCRNDSLGYFYKGIRHYLIDVADPSEVFTVADYKRLADGAIEEILGLGKLPIICGGTGFYIDVVIYDTALPAVPPQKDLRERLDKMTTREMFQELLSLDPERAKGVDSKNRRRLMRALEIIMISGRPVPKTSKRSLRFDVLKIGVRRDFEDLKIRIKKRLDERFNEGMIEEAELLERQGLGWERMEQLGLEYRYIARFLQGLIPEDEMKDKLYGEIVKYAKRQMTWFKRDKEIFWVEDESEAEKLIQKFVK